MKPWLIYLIAALIIGGCGLLTILLMNQGNQNPNPFPSNMTQNLTGYQLTQLTYGSLLTLHNSTSDCWTIIGDKVYNISGYISIHPGGPVISKACGSNGTYLFTTKGGEGLEHSDFAKGLLAQFLLGPAGSLLINISNPNEVDLLPGDLVQALSKFTSPNIERYEIVFTSDGKEFTLIYHDGVFTILPGNVTSYFFQQTLKNDTKDIPLPALDMDEVSKHDSGASCYLIIGSNVYDVTTFMPMHPGGIPIIEKNCGTDATAAFNTKGGIGTSHSSYALSLLNKYLLGPLSVPFINALTVTLQAPTYGQVLVSGTDQVDLMVKTDNPATCKWDTADRPYDLMRYLFSVTGTKTHSTGIIGLSDGNTYKSYVRCKSDIESSVLKVTFSVQMPLPASGEYLASQVSTHNSQSDCWLIINSNIYDVTSFIPMHPGGVSMIENNCGKESTSVFNTKGGSGNSHSSYANTLLAGYKIGTLLVEASAPPVATITSPSQNQIFVSGTTQAQLSVTTDKSSTCKWDTSDKLYATMTNTFSSTGGTSHSSTVTGLVSGGSYTQYVRCKDSLNNEMTTSAAVSFSVQAPAAPPPSTGYAVQDVALHNSQNNCLLIISSKVYDVTSYIPIHPGGPTRIISNCGRDATTAFNTRGGSGTHSSNAKNILSGFYLADLGGAASNTTAGGGGTGSGGGAIPTIQEVIEQNYPGASIKEINTEDDGTSEVQIRYNGNDMTVWLDSNHNLI